MFLWKCVLFFLIPFLFLVPFCGLNALTNAPPDRPLLDIISYCERKGARK